MQLKLNEGSHLNGDVFAFPVKFNYVEAQRMGDWGLQTKDFQDKTYFSVVFAVEIAFFCYNNSEFVGNFLFLVIFQRFHVKLHIFRSFCDVPFKLTTSTN